ncbi:type I polyketide synthase [Streptomyces sioyaensis]|uniref:type I polyketide synthase n=1 Tax=Streptomyces sioyaensis TaxID=67364 RepID=UPI0037AFD14F
MASDPMHHEEHDEGDDSLVAVVGLACRYPGADGPDAFWHNLSQGLETVTRFPRRPAPRGGSEYTPARGLLTDPEWFDAGYFGYSPREARLLNPQHRVFLECAVEALEDAGHDPARHPGSIGVYAGSTDTAYAQILKDRQDELPSVTDMEILVANAPDYLASRVAYKLGLRGPAVVVQAACATSLVAVHTAVQALLSGDCGLALAGGVAVRVPAKESPYIEGGIISADGTCRTFDAAAGGTVGGDGAGIVVLKRLGDALADGDRIRAVLRGSAVNNDGSNRVGFTAPSIEGQAAVIRDAQLVAGVDAGTITYVEAHGTATPIGDPIEIAALTKAFRADTDDTGFCRIGAVKSNIGHTDAAAGAAGLIKTVLALEHGAVPPSLNFTAPNPAIDFESSPFTVATALQEWRPEGGIPRRAGVSSFGIGGTNAHVVLEQAPEPSPSGPARPWQLLVLSGRTDAAVEAAAGRLAEHLRTHPEVPLADVAWTLQTGRRELPVRRYAVVGRSEDAVRVLGGLDRGRLVGSGDRPAAGPVTLVFPGTATSEQTRELYKWEPAFRRAADACLTAAGIRGEVPAALDVFATEFALARMWEAWGVRPAAVAGHGTGVLVAETVAGAYPLQEAVRMVVAGAGTGPDTPGGSTKGTPRIPVLPDVPGPLADGTGHTVLPVLTDATDHPGVLAALLETLGRLWLAGTPVDWNGVHEELPRLRVPLPVYPFQRERYVIEPAERRATTAQAPPVASVPEPAVPDTGALATLPAVAELFAQTLGLDDVDPDDSFFDLGGDSLIATQLLARARELFAVELETGALYEAQTAAELTELIEERLGRRGAAEPAPAA